MMTLEEAIIHCNEKACDDSICALEHKQLAEWLEELKKTKEVIKSLKSQNTWKPSEKQIMSLYNSIPNAAFCERETLTQLYVDLKKLKEYNYGNT